MQNSKPNLGFEAKYPAIVLENPKFPRNVSAIIRLASGFGIKQIWYTGYRMDELLWDMKRLPREERMKGYADVQLIGYDRPFDYMPSGTPVVVEFSQQNMPLTWFTHPDNAVYIFGPEDGGVSKGFRELAHAFVIIPSMHCLNLATSVACILCHRVTQRGWYPPRLVEYSNPQEFASDKELG